MLDCSYNMINQLKLNPILYHNLTCDSNQLTNLTLNNLESHSCKNNHLSNIKLNLTLSLHRINIDDYTIITSYTYEFKSTTPHPVDPHPVYTGNTKSGIRTQRNLDWTVFLPKRCLGSVDRKSNTVRPMVLKQHNDIIEHLKTMRIKLNNSPNDCT